MSNTLILPIAVPLWDAEPETAIVVPRPAPAAPARKRVRPRAERVGMNGAGYRALIDERPVTLINLSVSGAQVRGPVRVSRDQPLIFKVGWPQDKLSCAAIARVRWVYVDPDAPQGEEAYLIGLAFETSDVRRLKEIIHHSGRALAHK